jgi:hypothetical protein
MEIQSGLLSKTIIIGIIILFVGAVIAPTIVSDKAISTTFNQNGSLLGFVNDTSGNPIEGALIRVYFHGTYEEDYSDSTGYYHVTNIPICWCYKNCTTSMEGYETEWALLGIYENTTYDFVLTPIVQYNGSLSGYVNDTYMNPIEGARVRVNFHEIYEEDYSDSEGFYHVRNIPICYCLKNTTCSKEGYKTEWVLLGIVENTTYDFILTSNNPPDKPEITGPVMIHSPGPHEYTIKAIDPDGDDLFYEIDWADGTYEEWFGPYPAGEEITRNHTYCKEICAEIGVRAKDIHGATGEWAYLKVEISRSKQMTNPIILRFLEKFPLLEVILRAINLLR